MNSGCVVYVAYFEPRRCVTCGDPIGYQPNETFQDETYRYRVHVSCLPEFVESATCAICRTPIKPREIRVSTSQDSLHRVHTRCVIEAILRQFVDQENIRQGFGRFAQFETHIPERVIKAEAKAYKRRNRKESLRPLFDRLFRQKYHVDT